MTILDVAVGSLAASYLQDTRFDPELGILSVFYIFVPMSIWVSSSFLPWCERVCAWCPNMDWHAIWSVPIYSCDWLWYLLQT